MSNPHDKFNISEEQIKQKFNSLYLERLQSIKSENQAEIQQFQTQKSQIQNDKKLTKLMKDELIKDIQRQIDALKKDSEAQVSKLFQTFRQAFMEEVKKLMAEDQSKQKEVEDAINQFLQDQQKIWISPQEELIAAQSSSWMANPLPTKVKPLQKQANVPVKTALNQKVQITINKIVDSQGKPFEGKINLKSATCDSLAEPAKLKNLPPLLVINDAIPTAKLVSFSMQTNQFEDEKGRLIFPSEPLKVVEKIDAKKIKPEALKKYKVWDWDVIVEKWIQTGDVVVSQDGTELKYSIKPKSKEDIIRAFEKVGQTKKTNAPKLIFTVQNIQGLIPILKQLSAAYAKEYKNEQIYHEIRLVEYEQKSSSETDVKALEQQTKALKRVNQTMKNYGKSIFFDKISKFFLQRPTLASDRPQVKQQFIYIPKNLRETRKHSVYRTLTEINKKSIDYESQKIFIRSGDLFDESGMLPKQSIENLLVFKQKKQPSKFLIKEIYLESPNGKFYLKYIFIDPRNKFFVGKQFLEEINDIVNVIPTISNLNADTLRSLKEKMKSWEQITPFKKSQNQVSLTGKEIVQKNVDFVAAFSEEQAEVISEMMIESKLDQIKLSSTNSFLLATQMALLFSLSHEKVVEFELKIFYSAEPVLQNKLSKAKQYQRYKPTFYAPSFRYLEKYCEFFKIYAEDNEQTIRAIFNYHIKNTLNISQKRLMMPISDPEVTKFIKQIEEVFNEAVGKGLFGDDQMHKMVNKKIHNIKKEYLINAQWNQNQPLIQRIIDEFFPKTTYQARTYDQLINLISTYCKTRQILSSQQDIEKLKSKFEQKLEEYKAKYGKGLPGGVKANVVLAQLTQKFGAQAAREAMKSISNVDCLTDLNPAQIQQFESLAQTAAKQFKANVPNYVTQTNGDAQKHANNVGNSNPPKPSTQPPKSGGVSSSEANKQNQNQNNSNNATASNNTGGSKGPVPLGQNTKLQDQMNGNLGNSKKDGDGNKKNDKNDKDNKKLDTEEQKKLTSMITEINNLIDSYLAQIKDDADSADLQKTLNQIKAKAMPGIQQAQSALGQAKAKIDGHKLKKDNERQEILAKYKRNLCNTKTRVKNRQKELARNQEESKAIDEAQKKAKTAASQLIKGQFK